MPLLLLYSLLPKLSKTTWCTNRRYLKKLQSKQKHNIKIIFYENKLAYTLEHFKENNILNIYQLNILNDLPFLHRVEVPIVFLSKFVRLHHYPTSFSWNNYIVPSLYLPYIVPSFLTKSKYRIKIRAAKLWNII